MSQGLCWCLCVSHKNNFVKQVLDLKSRTFAPQEDSFYPIHIWIFTSCQTSLKTELTKLTKTKCLLREPAPDYGGALLLGAGLTGAVGPWYGPQGKLIQVGSDPW